MTLIRVKYRRLTVKVEATPPSSCECCGRMRGKKGKPLTFDLHHFKYAYKTSEVRKSPQLALENTIFLCFPCHRFADALRLVEANMGSTIKLTKLRLGQRKED